MQIEIYNRTSKYPNQMATMQLLRMTCPKCRQSVECVLSDEDRQYKPDFEHQKKLADSLMERNAHLESVIKHLEELLNFKSH